METERERLALTGVLLADIVLMFLPWFGKGELKILGIELMANPLTLLGVAAVMLGLWWLPRRRLTACLAGWPFCWPPRDAPFSSGPPDCPTRGSACALPARASIWGRRAP